MRAALVIIAQQGYQDIELAGVRDALVKAKFEVVLGSTAVGVCRGKFGGTETSTIALRDVHTRDYDRIAFIGGPGANELWKDEEAKRIARDTAEAEIPLGAICIAPKVLASAGVLKGKKATVWNKDGEQEAFLHEYGAQYTGDTVTRDGLILTGNGPEAAEEFGKSFAVLGE